MLRRFLSAYGKGLDATIRLIGMGIAASAIGWSINVSLQAANKALPPHLDWITFVIVLLVFPFAARLILIIGGLTASKPQEEIPPATSRRSAPAER